MNHDKVIDWHLDQFQNSRDDALPLEMQEYISQHPELQAELDTMALFWQDSTKMPAPSSAVRSRFYQSLSSIQQDNDEKLVPISNRQSHKKAPWWNHLNHNGWLQAAALAVVFIMGMYTGSEPSDTPSTQALSALQNEVASLSTVMAISMLQHESASQRLAGVSYTKQANLADPQLLDTLLNLLSSERSTAVKLAIIDALNGKQGLGNIETTLVNLAVSEPQPIVQMALSRLLLEAGSANAKSELIKQLQTQPVDQDVQEFLTLIDAQNRI